MARGKAIASVRLSVCLFVSAKSEDVGIRVPNNHNRNIRNDEKYLLSASEHMTRAMSATNRAFSFAMPIDHTYYVTCCTALTVLCMLELNVHVGKGHQVINCYKAK